MRQAAKEYLIDFSKLEASLTNQVKDLEAAKKADDLPDDAKQDLLKVFEDAYNALKKNRDRIRKELDTIR